MHFIILTSEKYSLIFPWLYLNIKTAWLFPKISWLFPDVGKKINFLTFPWPVWTLLVGYCPCDIYPGWECPGAIWFMRILAGERVLNPPPPPDRSIEPRACKAYSQVQLRPCLPSPTSMLRQRLQYAGLLKCFSRQECVPSSFTFCKGQGSEMRGSPEVSNGWLYAG